MWSVGILLGDGLCLGCPEVCAKTRLGVQVVSLRRVCPECSVSKRGNEKEGRKISPTLRDGMDKPPNVTLSGEESEVIHQLSPSLVKGCPGALTSWGCQSGPFLASAVRGCPPTRRCYRKPWWQRGALCK